jgi:hypothetical protein
MGQIVPFSAPKGCEDCLGGMPDQISVDLTFTPIGQPSVNCTGTLDRADIGFYEGNILCDNQLEFTVDVLYCADGNAAVLNTTPCAAMWAPGTGCGSFGCSAGDCFACVSA